jgi:hypothetical protein
MRTNRISWIVALVIVGVATRAPAQAFTDVTEAAGLAGAYGAVVPGDNLQALFTGGVAVGDYDGDGWEDVFWAGGSSKSCRLYRNNGDGTFTNVALEAGVAYKVPSSGPLWFDHDGDGDLDLYLSTYENQLDIEADLFDPWDPATFFGPGYIDASDEPQVTDVPSGVTPAPVVHRSFLFRNEGDGTFTEVGIQAGVDRSARFGASAGDLDGDGDLDLVTAVWFLGPTRFFYNTGHPRRVFQDRTPANVAADVVRGFTPTIIDLDNDGDNDVMMANDTSSSRYYRNDGGGVFTDIIGAAGMGTDENGMGSAFGDYDNDGDLDWFVTSIYSPFDIGIPAYNESGNRLFSNDGNGTSFTDVTDEAEVRDGGWGWGAQFADIDNDGDLDLVHANGWTEPDAPAVLDQFLDDTLRVFVNQGDGTFEDGAQGFGLDDPDQGRGLVVFDFDHDGALDILVANYDTGLTLWRNDATAVRGHWLQVALRTTAQPNTQAIGARMTLRVPGLPDQLRVVTCGNNYLSQAPSGAWFGLGSATSGTLFIRWPSGQLSSHPLAADQHVVIDEP